MDVAYCPDCKKAGLKWHDSQGKNPDGNTDHERYEKFQAGERLIVTGFLRWCPRCQKWVRPTFRNVMNK